MSDSIVIVIFGMWCLCGVHLWCFCSVHVVSHMVSMVTLWCAYGVSCGVCGCSMVTLWYTTSFPGMMMGNNGVVFVVAP